MSQRVENRGSQISVPSQWARRDTLMSRDKNCRETILSLDCLATTLTVGELSKEEKKPPLVGERHFGGGI